MQADPAIRRQRLLQCQPRQLVPEGDAALSGDDHPRGDALLEMLDLVWGKRVQQRDVGVRRRDGNRLEEPLRGRRQPRGTSEHRVADGRRHRQDAGRENLGDEEGVAAGLPVELLRVEAVRRCELSNGFLGKGREPEPRDIRNGRELAEHERQRMRALELVVPVAREN